MDKNINLKILNNIVLIGIILTVILLFFIPIWFTTFFKNTLGLTGGNIPLFISTGVYVCTIPYLVALLTLKKLCSSIYNKNLFLKEIPYLLKSISICAFSEIFIFNVVQLFLCYFFNFYLYTLNIVLTILISFISLFIGLFSLVLYKLSSTVIELKKENGKSI